MGSQDQPQVITHYHRTDGTSGAFTFPAGFQDVLNLRCLSIEIPMAEVYANVVFPAVDVVGID
jgi:hypothetical protein